MVEETIEPGKQIQIPSVVWNFQIIVNNLPVPIHVSLFHDDLVRPVVVIDAAKMKTKEDEELNTRLSGLVGTEI